MFRPARTLRIRSRTPGISTTSTLRASLLEMAELNRGLSQVPLNPGIPASEGINLLSPVQDDGDNVNNQGDTVDADILDENANLVSSTSSATSAV